MVCTCSYSSEVRNRASRESQIPHPAVGLSSHADAKSGTVGLGRLALRDAPEKWVGVRVRVCARCACGAVLRRLRRSIIKRLCIDVHTRYMGIGCDSCGVIDIVAFSLLMGLGIGHLHGETSKV